MLILSIQALSRRAWETVHCFLLQESNIFGAISLGFLPSSQGAFGGFNFLGENPRSNLWWLYLVVAAI
jgi:hypothetical protein